MTSANLFSREQLAGYNPALLRRSRIAVIGAGALGQNVVLSLALTGVKAVAIVDPDSFEATNAPRSPFFAAGAAKAPAVSSAFLALSRADDPLALSCVGSVEEVDDLVVCWADVVVAAVDRNQTRARLAESCRRHGKPLIEAGFHGFNISLSAFRNRSDAEACWRCGRRTVIDPFEKGLCTLYARAVEAGGFTPATQTVAQVAGGLIAEIAIEALHGDSTAFGTRAYFNLKSAALRRARITPDPACAGEHRRWPPPERIPLLLTSTAGELLAHSGAERFSLPCPFVERLPCAECGRSVGVATPTWRLLRAPRCLGACSADATPSPPMIIGAVSRDDPSLHGRTLSSLGVAPGAVLGVCIIFCVNGIIE